VQIPLYLPPVALKVENGNQYGLSDIYAWSNWHTTDMFPAGDQFVRLGPEGTVDAFSNDIV
jgi:hypothetical protein